MNSSWVKNLRLDIPVRILASGTLNVKDILANTINEEDIVINLKDAKFYVIEVTRRPICYTDRMKVTITGNFVYTATTPSSDNVDTFQKKLSENNALTAFQVESSDGVNSVIRFSVVV